ncbi:hypothetical protein ACFFKC_16410 [Pseudoduganella danionis]|uniref:DUF1640 domain-containing protein n=1 Tax=Pseudoduganella danionis TaxID=1890295 RepID=A0ABW9SRZ6_9BURK|nr:hypothetical protein [Pseudoduganella danionis]MTW33474.1 hypothetical protein [Pseudoduganella danionis]
MNKAPRFINTPPFPAVPNRERNSIDSRAKSAEDKTMETSIPKPAADLEALTNDLALIKVNHDTRSDVATAKAELIIEITDAENRLRIEGKETENRLILEIKDAESRLLAAINEARVDFKTECAKFKYELKTEIQESKTSIIIWVVSAIFLAQLMPAFLKKFGL